MLPGSRSVYRWTRSMVTSPARKGDDHAAADPAGDPGPRRPGRAGTPLPHHPRRPDPHPLPDGPAQRPGPHPIPDRAAGPVQRRYRPSGAQALPGRRGRRRAAPAPPRPAAPLPPAWEAELVRVADLDPRAVGVDSALWSCRLLADYLATITGHRAGIETVRIALHRAGFVCKRPRWVLSRKAQAQPGWAKNA